MAAGFAVAGAGVAGAAPGSVTWNDGNEKLTRTISDTTPAEGDIVIYLLEARSVTVDSS